MITSIEGKLAAATPLKAVLELGGLGYEVNIPVTTAEKLPAVGAAVKLHTVAIYREDSQALYGFATVADRDFFRLMIDHVNGVGPKLALTIMSRLSLPLLEGAIRAGDVTTLSKIPGIGKKTAERLVIELKSKLGVASMESPLAAPVVEPSIYRDAVAALVALGFKTPDADVAVRRAAAKLGVDATTEQLVRGSF
ncbi:MAG TPA: Holliday junction branch migration protein RuvA [Opitutaceae bacterium]